LSLITDLFNVLKKVKVKNNTPDPV